jgi:hypothetical protein
MAASTTEPAVGASTWASGSQVWTGHIGIFTANDAKKASHAQVCNRFGNSCFEQHLDVGGAGAPVHRHDGEQHQHRAEQRVEEELEAGIDPARAAPDADDQEHRDQAGLEEQIEQHQVEGAKTPTIIVSRTRKAIMYSLTRRWIESQLAMMQIGMIAKVVRMISGSEMPSTPIW